MSHTKQIKKDKRRGAAGSDSSGIPVGFGGLSKANQEKLEVGGSGGHFLTACVGLDFSYREMG